MCRARDDVKFRVRVSFSESSERSVSSRSLFGSSPAYRFVLSPGIETGCHQITGMLLFVGEINDLDRILKIGAF